MDVQGPTTTSILPAEEATECGEQVWFLKLDLSDAFGSIRHRDVRRILVTRVGVVAARAMMQIIVGRPWWPRWAMPRDQGDKAGWATDLTFNDDMLLVAKRSEEVHRMHHDLTTCCEQ